MSRRSLISLAIVLALPWLASAQGPEKYLPSGSQIVVQVDAAKATKAAYDRTVYGQMMNGDTGKFWGSFYQWILDSGETAASEFQMPSKEDIALIKDGVKVFERMMDEGIALGIDVKQAWPPQVRAVVVLPQLATGKPNIVKLLAEVRAKAQNNAPGQIEIKEVKIGNRAVSVVEVPMAGELGWWAEGNDFVLTLGTDPVADYIKAIDAGATGLAKNSTYKKLLDLGAFPTRSRAYLDVPSLVKLGDNIEPAKKTIDTLGLRGVGPILSISGYDGPALRTITEVETTAPRSGLTGLMSPKTFSLVDLPPMPSDLTSFSAYSANAGKMYGTGFEIVEKLLGIYMPDQAENIVDGLKAFEGIIGVDLQKDVFTNFDDLTVTYSSPSECMGLGSTLFKVKDEAKLRKAFANIAGALPNLPGVDSGLKIRKYRGVDVFELHLNTPGNFSMQTFAVHKGYMVYSNYPQGVHGYILRTQDKLPSWKSDERLTKTLAAFPKQYSGISFSDPRGTYEQLLSAMPPIITFANGFTGLVPGLAPFEVSQVPHAQEASAGLFPTISIVIDDGKKVRTDTRSSVGW